VTNRMRALRVRILVATAIALAAGKANVLAGPDASTKTAARPIGIEVPAFHGIEPRLTVSEPRDGAKGLLGERRRLDGVAVIERMRVGREVVRSDEGNVLLLNGQELLPCSAARGSRGCVPGATHTTTQISFHRIEYESAKDLWTVWLAPGICMELTPVLKKGAKTVVWGQTATRDVEGNRVEFSWASSNDDARPETVAYGETSVRLFVGSATAGGSGQSTDAGALRSIVIRQNGAVTGAYGFDYSPSVAASRPVLRSVKEYGPVVSVDVNGEISAGVPVHEWVIEGQ
jgi:hypothetical protein